MRGIARRQLQRALADLERALLVRYRELVGQHRVVRVGHHRRARELRMVLACVGTRGLGRHARHRVGVPVERERRGLQARQGLTLAVIYHGVTQTLEHDRVTVRSGTVGDRHRAVQKGYLVAARHLLVRRHVRVVVRHRGVHNDNRHAVDHKRRAANIDAAARDGHAHDGVIGHQRARHDVVVRRRRGVRIVAVTVVLVRHAPGLQGNLPRQDGDGTRLVGGLVAVVAVLPCRVRAVHRVVVELGVLGVGLRHARDGARTRHGERAYRVALQQAADHRVAVARRLAPRVLLAIVGERIQCVGLDRHDARLHRQVVRHAVRHLHRVVLERHTREVNRDRVLADRGVLVRRRRQHRTGGTQERRRGGVLAVHEARDRIAQRRVVVRVCLECIYRRYDQLDGSHFQFSVENMNVVVPVVAAVDPRVREGVVHLAHVGDGAEAAEQGRLRQRVAMATHRHNRVGSRQTVVCFHLVARRERDVARLDGDASRVQRHAGQLVAGRILQRVRVVVGAVLPSVDDTLARTRRGDGQSVARVEHDHRIHIRQSGQGCRSELAVILPICMAQAVILDGVRLGHQMQGSRVLGDGELARGVGRDVVGRHVRVARHDLQAGRVAEHARILAHRLAGGQVADARDRMASHEIAVRIGVHLLRLPVVGHRVGVTLDLDVALGNLEGSGTDRDGIVASLVGRRGVQHIVLVGLRARIQDPRSRRHRRHLAVHEAFQRVAVKCHRRAGHRVTVVCLGTARHVERHRTRVHRDGALLCGNRVQSGRLVGRISLVDHLVGRDNGAVHARVGAAARNRGNHRVGSGHARHRVSRRVGIQCRAVVGLREVVGHDEQARLGYNLQFAVHRVHIVDIHAVAVHIGTLEGIGERVVVHADGNRSGKVGVVGPMARKPPVAANIDLGSHERRVLHIAAHGVDRGHHHLSGVDHHRVLLLADMVAAGDVLRTAQHRYARHGIGCAPDIGERGAGKRHVQHVARGQRVVRTGSQVHIGGALRLERVFVGRDGGAVVHLHDVLGHHRHGVV